MDVRSLCPLPVASIVWQPARGRHSLTVVCKATYDLAPGLSTLSQSQEHLCEEDEHWNDDASRSLRSPSDRVPFKARGDVLLVGRAFAPRGEPVTSLIARMVIGDVDKSIEVTGDRSFTREGALRDGGRFVSMPLVYERAAAGPENPVGVRADLPNAYGVVTAPNLLPPGMTLSGPSEHIPAVGFGPIAPTWRPRADRLGPHAGAWPGRDWTQRPIPEGIEASYFNAAPRDQQVDALRSDERIVLEHLHQSIPRLVTSLPGVTPQAFVELAGRPPQAIALTCDTLWLDTDRAICTLTWRGHAMLDHPSQVGRAFVLLAQPGERLAWADVERLARARGALEGESRASQLTSTLQEDEDDARQRTIAVEDTPQVRAAPLPFNRSDVNAPPPPPPPAPPPPPPPRTGLGRSMTAPIVTSGAEVVRPSGPAWIAPAAAPRSPGTDASGAPTSGPAAAPRPVVPPSAVPPPPAALPIPPPPAAAPPPASPWAVSQPSAPLPVWEPSPVPSPAPPAPKASAPIAAEPPVKAALREYLDLLWFEAEAVRRMRSVKAWSDALAAPEDGDWVEGDSTWKTTTEASERTDVLRLLTKVKPLSAEELLSTSAEAVDETGTFSPPLVIMTGELQLTFDELEALKAHVTAAAPLASTDKRLREAVDAATEALKFTWPPPAALAESLTTRIKEAFAQGNRALPAGYFEASAERALLGQRLFQKRTILGKTRLRSLFTPAGGASPIPLYLPESLTSQLPMFQRFRATIAAEAQGQQDQFESHPVALLALALGRLLPVPGAAHPGSAGQGRPLNAR